MLLVRLANDTFILAVWGPRLHPLVFQVIWDFLREPQAVLDSPLVALGGSSSGRLLLMNLHRPADGTGETAGVHLGPVGVAHAVQVGEPVIESGRQERLEAIMNRFIVG